MAVSARGSSQCAKIETMPREKSGTIRVSYNKPLLIGLITGAVLIIIAGACFLLILSRPIGESTQYGPTEQVTHRILMAFNKMGEFLNIRKIATPSPTPPVEPTLSPPFPGITPKTLQTNNPLFASQELSHVILELKQKGLTVLTVERLYFQGKNELENGNQEAALRSFRTGYDLAQEILVAADYYLGTL